MIENIPLLTVVIPTRNRFNYVKSAIQSVLRIASPQLQIAVEDNSDTNELELWLQENNFDSRLTYHYSNIRASMSENYDRAMSLAKGEYICLIGDDDGVNPEIIEATRWAKDNEFDALVPSSLINYIWPDLQMTSPGSMEAGELCIRPFSGEKTYPDPEAEMFKCVRTAGQNFHKLPKAYYGIVRKECMDNVKEKTGTFFPGISPDMAASLAVANYTKRICHIDYPLFVPGSSANSNAGLSGLNKHIGRLRDQPHLPSTCEQEWSDIVPLFYSVQTIWAEATVGALRSVERDDVLEAFNVPWLYAFCYIFHFQYMNNSVGCFYRALHALRQGYFVGTLQFIYWFCYWWGLRVKSLILRFVGTSHKNKSYYIKGLHNIDEAVQSVTEYLKKSGLKFKEIVK